MNKYLLLNYVNYYLNKAKVTIVDFKGNTEFDEVNSTHIYYINENRFYDKIIDDLAISHTIIPEIIRNNLNHVIINKANDGFKKYQDLNDIYLKKTLFKREFDLLHYYKIFEDGILNYIVEIENDEVSFNEKSFLNVIDEFHKSIEDEYKTLINTKYYVINKEKIVLSEDLKKAVNQKINPNFKLHLHNLFKIGSKEVYLLNDQVSIINDYQTKLKKPFNISISTKKINPILLCLYQNGFFDFTIYQEKDLIFVVIFGKIYKNDLPYLKKYFKEIITFENLPNNLELASFINFYLKFGYDKKSYNEYLNEIDELNYELEIKTKLKYLNYSLYQNDEYLGQGLGYPELKSFKYLDNQEINLQIGKNLINQYNDQLLIMLPYDYVKNNIDYLKKNFNNIMLVLTGNYDRDLLDVIKKFDNFDLYLDIKYLNIDCEEILSVVNGLYIQKENFSFTPYQDFLLHYIIKLNKKILVDTINLQLKDDHIIHLKK